MDDAGRTELIFWLHITAMFSFYVTCASVSPGVTARPTGTNCIPGSTKRAFQADRLGCGLTALVKRARSAFVRSVLGAYRKRKVLVFMCMRVSAYLSRQVTVDVVIGPS
ncbi:hypothetical protein NP493_182g02045 [Ridgeia piscesae]|uniref:Uncharacterized protein n=1 Tax=Ridgeia piscesae TaxID=27915 RepID=A0AAD9UF13_RIDPI|nr:hypothetical protein NP493_182g02045 [Ridgeia piscesae]